MTERVYEIVLVEDNPGDVMLVEESLKSLRLPFHMTHCETVNIAVKTINGYGAGDGNVPDLLLLDYNLPGGEAHEVLAAAMANPALARTRKAVITSSMSPRDHENALRRGAECVIGKPADLDLFLGEVGSAIVKLLALQDPPADGSSSRAFGVPTVQLD